MTYDARRQGEHDSHKPELEDVGGRPLRRSRDFGVFWVAQTLSVLGDSFALIALPLLILQATGSLAAMGLLTAVGGAAAVVAAVFAGAVVDRVDRRKLLIGCDLVRMVLYGVIPVVWLFGPQIWLLYVVLPLCEAVGMLFAVGYVTVVRSLVGTEQLTEANGRLNATAAAAGVLGPLCAGLVAAWSGPATAVGVDAASFGVSAACLVVVRFRGRPGDDDRPKQRTSLWNDLRAGIAFLYGHPVLRSLTVLLCLFSFFTLGLNDLVIYHLKHDLGHDDGTVGTVMVGGALGTIAGSLLVARIRHAARLRADLDGRGRGVRTRLRRAGPGAGRPRRGRPRRGLPRVRRRRGHLLDVPAPGSDPRAPAGPGHLGLLDPPVLGGPARRRRPHLGRGAPGHGTRRARRGRLLRTDRGRRPVHADSAVTRHGRLICRMAPVIRSRPHSAAGSTATAGASRGTPGRPAVGRPLPASTGRRCCGRGR